MNAIDIRPAVYRDLPLPALPPVHEGCPPNRQVAIRAWRIRETPKAVLVERGGKTAWLPTSVATFTPSVPTEPEFSGSSKFLLPVWLYRRVREQLG